MPTRGLRFVEQQYDRNTPSIVLPEGHQAEVTPRIIIGAFSEYTKTLTRTGAVATSPSFAPEFA